MGVRRRQQLIFNFVLLVALLSRTSVVTAFAVTPTPKSTPQCPPTSPATGLENKFYTWKEGQQIRYQSTADENKSKTSTGPPVLLVHGLFVNSDHWRKALQALASDGYNNVYAVDLLGCGYSDKPPADSAVAQRCNGETLRFGHDDAVLPDVQLGTAQGGSRVANVDLRHPLRSPYNFFTWGDLLQDFTRDVILPENKRYKDATLVCNSIGTISALQAALDNPSLFNGVFIVSPNFRELHSAEVPFASYTMPLIQSVQALLRGGWGQKAFDALATPGTVQQILQEPYAVTAAVDATLVQVLLDPLLTPGASDVVFDTLSYSAGPLPEQQLQSFDDSSNHSRRRRRRRQPVWVCYGDQDPWTPGRRVEALVQYPVVERVVSLPGVGHCPHDEAPELVHPLLQEFLEKIQEDNQ